MSHHFIIGLVKETTADKLSESSVMIHKGIPTHVTMLKSADTEVYISFDYAADGRKWDLTLTKDQKVYILEATRVTGLKERE